ncbi:uncharacterized protein [Misgurnus anguillicaudatus]|uniref:uncharacterized protein n=1 Tax=Misgurnus anguillicaudatus TaxID=75329 RepID=UPI003CCFB403
MSRPLTSFMVREGADVANMDFCLPNAVLNFDTEAKSPKTVFKAEMDAFLSNAFLTFDNVLNTESLSEVMHAAGSANPCGGVEEDSPANAGAKSPTVFEQDMDLFLSNAFLGFDTVLNTGPLSEFGKAAGSVNPCGEVEEDSPANAGAKSPTVFEQDMDLFLSNAFLSFDTVLNTGPLSEFGKAAGSVNPCGGVEMDSPANAGAKSPTVFEQDMDLFLSDTFLSFDTVLNTGPLSEFGKAAGSVNPCGEVEEMEKVSPAYAEAKSPTMLGRSQDSGMDFVLPCALPESVLNIGSLLDRRAGRGKEFTPTFDEANSPIDSNISPDQRKTYFDRAWRGKVEPVPAPQLEADPAIPDVREVVDLAFWSKTKIGQKKQKASKSRLFDLQEEKTVVQAQHVEADSAIPVGMDVADFACPESNICIRTEKRKTLKSRLFDRFRRGNLESVPTPQLDADLANPVGMDGADLACHEAKTKIRPDKRMSKKCCFLDCFRRSNVESLPTPQLDDDLASRELNPHISFPAITATNASLQKLGAVPPNFGLKGGGNPDPKRPENPRTKAIGNPRNPVPKDAGNPVPKDAGNPKPKDAGNPVRKDVKVVRPKTSNLFKKQSKKKPTDPEPGPSVTTETLESKYQLLEMDVLGQGSFGVVFKGIRQTDGNLVAIKQIMKQEKKDRYIQIPGYPKPLLTEIALMLKLREGYRCPNIIEMYDWYETSEMFSIVMEYPQESESLFRFAHKHKLSENAARHLMYQAVKAVEHCLLNDVIHTDIHAGNFLVQKKTMKLKLIDFGLGHVFNCDGHGHLSRCDGHGHLVGCDGHDSKDFIGAAHSTPPEVHTSKQFFAMPANAWALGVLLYFMMHGAYPQIWDLYEGEPKKYDEGLSKEIRELIDWCLDVRPHRRPWLHQILSHDWFRTDWRNEKPEFERRKSIKKPTKPKTKYKLYI